MNASVFSILNQGIQMFGPRLNGDETKKGDLIQEGMYKKEKGQH